MSIMMILEKLSISGNLCYLCHLPDATNNLSLPHLSQNDSPLCNASSDNLDRRENIFHFKAAQNLVAEHYERG